MALIPSAASRAGRRVLVAAGMALALGLGGRAAPVGAAVQPVGELQVKAAFLFNFAKFVAWPRADRPLAICVAGNTDLTAAAVAIVTGRPIDGRQVVARAVTAAGTAEECDLLYLGDLSPDDASAFLARVRGPVLTVGETARFLRDGGMVRIYLDGNRMRFQVNRRQTDAAGLKISSQLLSLASQ
ncbi:MAG: YfiR family protein [Vicinamibacterales bacterium]